MKTESPLDRTSEGLGAVTDNLVWVVDPETHPGASVKASSQAFTPPREGILKGAFMNKRIKHVSYLVLASFLLTAPLYEADRKVIRPARPNEPPAQSSAPRLGGILSPGIMTGDSLYCAGAGSRDPKTGEHPEGFEAQVKQSMENLGEVLKAAGLGFSDVVNSNVYLTDIKNFQAMNKVYKTYFPQKPPARTTIAVPALPGGSHVEITFIASRNKKRKYIYPAGVKPAPADLFSSGVVVGDVFYLWARGVDITRPRSSLRERLKRMRSRPWTTWVRCLRLRAWISRMSSRPTSI